MMIGRGSAISTVVHRDCLCSQFCSSSSSSFPSIWNFKRHKSTVASPCNLSFTCLKRELLLLNAVELVSSPLSSENQTGPTTSLPFPSFSRTCSCLMGRSNHTIQSTYRRSHFGMRVFSSHGSREAHIDSTVAGKDMILIDCGSEQECVVGGIVALGKFDALHIGHRELAIQASRAGTPFLLSFVGIAEVLGLEPRAPLVAKCDRKRVLSSWSPYCGNIIPQEFQVEFSSVRHLSPQQFVERLSRELRVNGVVAGENYRFGYRASGDASELVRLCKEYGLEAYIVNAVMDDKPLSCNNGVGTYTYTSDREKVSSTRVRRALATGDMESVTMLLGRKHRLVLTLNDACTCTGERTSLPKSCMLNQPPKDGLFENCSLLVDDKLVCPCKVTLDSENVHIKLETGGSLPLDHSRDKHLISVEFGW